MSPVVLTYWLALLEGSRPEELPRDLVAFARALVAAGDGRAGRVLALFRSAPVRLSEVLGLFREPCPACTFRIGPGVGLGPFDVSGASLRVLGCPKCGGRGWVLKNPPAAV